MERDLHDGVHQHLIAFAVRLQLAGHAPESDPASLTALLGEMSHAVHNALDETARLAQRIHPATLDTRDLAALLRSAATAAGVPATVDVTATGSYPPEAVMTIHLCWLDTLDRAGRGSRTAIEVHGSVAGLAFEVTGTDVQSIADLDRVRDRVEALGGRLTITTSPRGETVVAGSLPLEQ